MALRDWIFRAIKDDTATSATVATHDNEKTSTVAKVATVAVANLEHVNRNVITDPSTTINDLIRLHPPLVLGCKLIDVLAHADINDYEDLIRIDLLEAFVQGLLNLGEIQTTEAEHIKD